LYKRGFLASTQRDLDPIAERISAFREIDLALDTFLAAFNRRRFHITRGLMQKASVMTATYDLQSHDALVVALMRDLGVNSIAAIDRGFRTIDGLELWDGLLVM
jgi:predicted nucleic acid-binding protein